MAARGREAHGQAGASAARKGRTIAAAHWAERLREIRRTAPYAAAGSGIGGWAVAEATTPIPGRWSGLPCSAASSGQLVHRSAARPAGTKAPPTNAAPAANSGRWNARGWSILHDRAIPGSRANLDHLLIGPPGVLYLDTKHWQAGRAQIRHGELWNGRHNQTKALGTVVWEASQAAKALATPVRAVVSLHPAKPPADRRTRRGRHHRHRPAVRRPPRLAAHPTRPVDHRPGRGVRRPRRHRPPALHPLTETDVSGQPPGNPNDYYYRRGGWVRRPRRRPRATGTKSGSPFAGSPLGALAGRGRAVPDRVGGHQDGGRRRERNGRRPRPQRHRGTGPRRRRSRPAILRPGNRRGLARRGAGRAHPAGHRRVDDRVRAAVPAAHAQRTHPDVRHRRHTRVQQPGDADLPHHRPVRAVVHRRLHQGVGQGHHRRLAPPGASPTAGSSPPPP
ncbi:nuclease-related domain-containing protein [Yinghuangia aomiensis]